jgi:hypothetical protein
LCYLRWFLTQKMKHFCVINYPAEELEYDDWKIVVAQITTNDLCLSDAKYW